MNEVQFFKFITDISNELRWEGEMLLSWIPSYSIEGFIEKLDYDSSDDGGYEARIQSNCICIDIADLCWQYGVDPEDIIKKETN